MIISSNRNRWVTVWRNKKNKNKKKVTIKKRENKEKRLWHHCPWLTLIRLIDWRWSDFGKKKRRRKKAEDTKTTETDGGKRKKAVTDHQVSTALQKHVLYTTSHSTLFPSINYRWMLWLMTLFDLCICVLLSPNTLCLWVQYTNDVYLTLFWHKQVLGLGRDRFTNKNNK